MNETLNAAAGISSGADSKPGSPQRPKRPANSVGKIRRRPGNDLFRDSMTMKATGIVDDLHRDGHYRLFDGFDPAMPRPQKLEIRRQGLLADLFITGINAVTEDGALLWLDMIGNRIAPIAFGPRKVLLVVGRNKITPTREAAEERIRTIAAPQNIARHPGFRTPCAVTGVCADCYSEDRICNTHLRMERCFPASGLPWC